MTRLTPAQADALVAHLSPAERRRQLAVILEALRIKGVEAREVIDAAGRSYIKMDLDQVRERMGDAVAAELLALHELGPEPQAHTQGVA